MPNTCEVVKNNCMNAQVNKVGENKPIPMSLITDHASCMPNSEKYNLLAEPK